MPDPAARIPMITEAERTDEVRAVFAAIAGVGPDSNVDGNHVLKTFAHHPQLTQLFLSFNRHLLSTTTLPVRLRQLAILRTAWVRHCRYMWSSHLNLSLSLGLDGDDFAAAKIGPSADRWSDTERTVLAAVDQTLADTDLDDAHWDALAKALDRKQILDLMFTVGTYAALAIVFNVSRVAREPNLEALGDQYGAP